MLGYALKSAAYGCAALGLAFETVGELAPGAFDKAGDLLLGFALARLDRRIQEEPQQPTLPFCGGMRGNVLERMNRGLGKLGEGREGG